MDHSRGGQKQNDHNQNGSDRPGQCIQASSEYVGREWAQTIQLQGVGGGVTRNPQAPHASVVTVVWQVTNHSIIRIFFGSRRATFVWRQKGISAVQAFARPPTTGRMTFGRQPGMRFFWLRLRSWPGGAMVGIIRVGGRGLLRWPNNSDLRWRHRNSHRFFSQTSFLSARQRTPALRGLRQIPQPFER